MCQINRIETFDSFDWDLVFSAFQKFGYGDKFIPMIKVELSPSKKNLRGFFP